MSLTWPTPVDVLQNFRIESTLSRGAFSCLSEGGRCSSGLHRVVGAVEDELPRLPASFFVTGWSTASGDVPSDHALKSNLANRPCQLSKHVKLL